MKRKIYIRVAVLFFIAGITVILSGLTLMGQFNRNKLLVKTLTCDDCATYQVILGSYKLSGSIPDSVKNSNLLQVYITGLSNPDEGDYTRTYDYYIITGTISGWKQVRDGEPWSPLIAVTNWQHFYPLSLWALVLPVIILFGLSLRYYRRFINANKISVLRSSLMNYKDGSE